MEYEIVTLFTTNIIQSLRKIVYHRIIRFCGWSIFMEFVGAPHPQRIIKIRVSESSFVL